MLNPSDALNQQGDIPEYPQPESIAPSVGAATPFPVKQLPKVMKNAINAIADFEQVPLALAGQAVLGAAAYVAQTRVDAWSHVSYQMPCSLYLLSLGNSGEGKSSAYRQAFKPIDEAEWELKSSYTKELKKLDEAKSGLSGKELKQFEKANPSPFNPSTIIESDGSISRIMSMFVDGASSLFWNTDEGGQMLGGHSLKAENRVATLGTLTQLWDTGKGERLRSKDNADSSGSFKGRRLSISLMAQEVAVRESLNDPILREQGFLPRFIFSAPDSLVGTRILTPARLHQQAKDVPAITTYWQRLSDLMATPVDVADDGVIQAKRLELTPDAKDIWLGYRNAIEGEQGQFNTYENLRPFASRAAQNTLRIATVLAFFDNKPKVDAQAMEAAYLIANHSLQEWKRYAEATAIDPALKLAQVASEWLLKEASQGRWLEFSANDWGKSGCSTGNMRTAKVRDRVFKVLIEKNHLLAGAGRNFKLNPLLIAADSADIAETHVA